QCSSGWPHWQAEITHFAIALGDQPQISRDTLDALIKHATIHFERVCQPSVDQRRKHPVILPRLAFERLSSTAHSTLRDFLENCGIARSLMEIPDPALEIDLDLPSEYAAAREIFG